MLRGESLSMPDLTEVKMRIARGEDFHTEFKEQQTNPDSMARTIVSFANSDGGWILIGVADDGTVKGVSNVDQVCQWVDNIALNNCEPPIVVRSISVEFEDGKAVVLVEVPRGEMRPYKTRQGVPWVRTSSGTRPASNEELRRMLQSSGYLYYDETLVYRSGLSDLDSGAIDELIKSALDLGIEIGDMPQDRLLMNWRLLGESERGKQLTVAGALFLARRPQEHVPYAYVSALRIPGTEISNVPQDQKRIEGRVRQILEDTLRFLQIHLRCPHQLVAMEPEAEPEIPLVVLRELLVNAVAHRDYTISGPIRVIVFDDRVEIWTPGLLPNTVTIESLRTGIHVLRNPTIYNILLKLRLVTDAGSGIPRVIRLMREKLGLEPQFSVENQQFVVRLPRPSIGQHRREI
ncbi:MAG: putative DNA binding domain-containing protein [Candidatus Fermentithermobacillus carboniphilus]|uniref:DNA binding domain-containing protein n=1 Tax=Candidatus Fermentithermobacillus carboniphilus TaxID=3085328 RepID=A0AAT9LE52_9FIRM|nr:MAG: putative DNA binding domain-containing protein [Candidatus Fermentithermobacillus carboniphilus]